MGHHIQATTVGAWVGYCSGVFDEVPVMTSRQKQKRNDR